MNRHELMQQAREIASETMVLLEGRGCRDMVEKIRSLRWRWNNRLTTTAGKAKCMERVVELSWPVFQVEENRAGFRNTVLHEIAHHLVPRGSGHNRNWRAVCISIGGNGERCHNLKVTRRESGHSARLKMTCRGCNLPVSLGPVQQRRMVAGQATYSCRQCHTPLRTDAAVPTRNLRQQ